MKISRNSLCPCGSNKKYKRCCLSKVVQTAHCWMDDEGIHVVSSGEPMTSEQLDSLSEKYQKNLRSSPMWKEMVKEFGQQEAEALLKQCRVESR